MAFSAEVLRRRARRAYELGRLRAAVPWAILVAAIGLLASRLVNAGGFGLAMTVAAGAAVVGCVSHGRQLGRGVWPGVWVGSAAVVIALVAWVCEGRGASSFLQCRLPCLLAGIAIGAAAVYHRARGTSAADNLITLLATAAIATPLALIVCAGVGLGGVLGLGAGLILGSLPLVVQAARAA
jgi:hypothetical protein